MRRYEIAPLIGSGTALDEYHPDVTGPYVVIATRGAWCLIKRPVPDGTARTPTTLADLMDETDDVEQTAFSAAQRTAIKTRLGNAGLDVWEFDGNVIDDRRKLLRFVVRKAFGLADIDAVTLIHGYDVAAVA